MEQFKSARHEIISVEAAARMAMVTDIDPEPPIPVIREVAAEPQRGYTATLMSYLWSMGTPPAAMP